MRDMRLMRLPPAPPMAQRIEESRKVWRDVETIVRKHKRTPLNDPDRVAYKYLYGMWADYRLYRAFVRDCFGVERRGREVCVIDEALLPRSRDEQFFYEAATQVLADYERELETIGNLIKAVPREDLGRVVCEYMIEDLENGIAEFASSRLRAWHEDVRETAAVGLAGWLLSNHVSWRGRQNIRIRRALESFGGKEESLDALLVSELPAAALIAWSERLPDEPLRPSGNRKKNLVSRVQKLLAELGGEGVEKKLLADHPQEDQTIGQTAAALAEFEREEALRQELNRLQDCVGEAQLSEQQRQVYELDIQTDRDVSAIARTLGITENHVYKVCKNYLDKLRRAAGL